MHWLLQTNCFSEAGFRRLLQVLERLGLPHSIHNIIPFTMTLEPEFQDPVNSPIIVLGALKFARIAKERNFWPGSFLNENFDFQVYREHWAGHLLNGDAWFGRFADVPPPTEALGDPFFIRPVHDNKAFNGTVLTYAEYQAKRYQVVDLGVRDGYILDADTPVLVSQATNLFQEYRIWIVAGKVVTGSLYKLNRRPTFRAQVDDDVLKYAAARAKEWGPADAYVLDIARTSAGLSILEAGNINSAGFYEAEMSRIVEALEAYALRRA
jgi:hypothetical protein